MCHFASPIGEQFDMSQNLYSGIAIFMPFGALRRNGTKISPEVSKRNESFRLTSEPMTLTFGLQIITNGNNSKEEQTIPKASIHPMICSFPTRPTK